MSIEISYYEHFTATIRNRLSRWNIVEGSYISTESPVGTMYGLTFVRKTRELARLEVFDATSKGYYRGYIEVWSDHTRVYVALYSDSGETIKVINEIYYSESEGGVFGTLKRVNEIDIRQI